MSDESIKKAEPTLPPWTSDQPGEKYMLKARGSRLEPFMHKNNGQRIVGKVKDGPEVKSISVPFVHYDYWIDSAGNIVNPANKTTREMDGGDFVDGGNYALFQRQARLRAGWIPYHEVPPGKTPEQWATERAETIEERQRAHAEKQNKVYEQFRHLSDPGAARVDATTSSVIKAAGIESVPKLMEQMGSALKQMTDTLAAQQMTGKKAREG
jgi:hypothetical protein